jgi:NitT/TauT family transport system permease protein
MSSPITSAASCSSVVPPDTSATGSSSVKRALALASRFSVTILFVIIIAAWEAACRAFSIPTFLLPSPSLIVTGALDQAWSTWAGHIWATVRVALMGYALAIVVSIPLAVMLATSPFLERTFYPVIVGIHSMPIVAVAPIIVVTLGSSDLPRVVITFLITFFPIVVTTTAGLMATPPEMIEFSRSLRAGRTREITQIRLPFAVPYIFSALKISITLAFVGAVVAEFVAAERGLGYFIQLATTYFKINQSFAALLVLMAINMLAFQVVTLIQVVFAPWSLPKDRK